MIKYQSELRDAKAKLEALLSRVALLAEAAAINPEVQAEFRKQEQEIEDLQEQIAWYSEAKKHCLEKTCSLKKLGRLLVYLRLCKGLSQYDLAELLGVSSVQVSKDERNEYKGISLDRAVRILDALEVDIKISTNAGNGIQIQVNHTSSTRNATPLPALEVEAPLDSAVVQTEPPPPIVERKQKANLKLKIACKNKVTGIGQQVQKSTKEIEETVLSKISAKKISAATGWLEFTGIYEFEMSEKDWSNFDIKKLADECEYLAAGHKCLCSLSLEESN